MIVPDPVTVTVVTPFWVLILPTDDAPVVEDRVYLYVVPVSGDRYWKVCWLPWSHHNDIGRLERV